MTNSPSGVISSNKPFTGQQRVLEFVENDDHRRGKQWIFEEDVLFQGTTRFIVTGINLPSVQHPYWLCRVVKVLDQVNRRDPDLYYCIAFVELVEKVDKLDVVADVANPNVQDDRAVEHKAPKAKVHVEQKPERAQKIIVSDVVFTYQPHYGWIGRQTCLCCGKISIFIPDPSVVPPQPSGIRYTTTVMSVEIIRKLDADTPNTNKFLVRPVMKTPVPKS